MKDDASKNGKFETQLLDKNGEPANKGDATITLTYLPEGVAVVAAEKVAEVAVEEPDAAVAAAAVAAAAAAAEAEETARKAAEAAEADAAKAVEEAAKAAEVAAAEAAAAEAAVVEAVQEPVEVAVPEPIVTVDSSAEAVEEVPQEEVAASADRSAPPPQEEEVSGPSMILSISCKDLPKGDTFSKSDPIVAVYQKQAGADGGYSLVGHTEHQDNEHNPVFVKTVTVTAAVGSEFKVIAYDTDKEERLDDKDRLGSAVVSVADVLAMKDDASKNGKFETQLLDKNGEPANKGDATITLTYLSPTDTL
jgi:hypothetical protein